MQIAMTWNELPKPTRQRRQRLLNRLRRLLRRTCSEAPYDLEEILKRRIAEKLNHRGSDQLPDSQP